MSTGSGVSCCAKGGDRMSRRTSARLFTVAAIAAVVLGVVSTFALAGWPSGGSSVTTAPHARMWGWGTPGTDVNGMAGESDYLTHMVAHHQEAVAAARQLERSGRAEMRALGASIVTTQTAEMASMNAWLARWYPGRPTEVGYQPMMRDLSELSGDALDEAFLRDMIPHHMVAVMASQQLLVHGRIQHPRVADFARAVRDAQATEIAQMRRYLADWFGVGSPMPYGAGPGGMMGW
jgi:uncharacterized protein (DUF305 family)